MLRQGLEILSPKYNSDFSIIGGKSHPELFQEVTDRLDTPLLQDTKGVFNAGEDGYRIQESVREKRVYVLETHVEGYETSDDGKTQRWASVNDRTWRHQLMIRAAIEASASDVRAISPWAAYMRQDRKSEGREPISAKLLIDQFAAAGASHYLAVNLHAEQIQGFTPNPRQMIVENLPSRAAEVSYILENFEEEITKGELTLASADVGGAKDLERIQKYLAEKHGIIVPIAIVSKYRPAKQFSSTGRVHNEVTVSQILGNVEGQTVLFIDDMYDSASTIITGGNEAMNKGAVAVHAIATHGLYSGDAIYRLQYDSPFSTVASTNTVPLKKTFEKYRKINIAGLLADAIFQTYNQGSLSSVGNSSISFDLRKHNTIAKRIRNGQPRIYVPRNLNKAA